MKLSARCLRKSYRATTVVENVSLEVTQGEIVGLLGPNGAGKTTCFHMLVGLIRADEGNISIGEQDLTTAAVDRRAKAGLGYLPQEASVFRGLSVSDNLRATLQLNEALNPDQQQRRLEALLAEFGLTSIQNTLGHRLSGGERRRLEIARALATDPAFILLDEPFAGVDPISVKDIKSEINDLSRRGIGILITDHNVRETLDICHRAYIVHQGSIIAQGSPTEILDSSIVRKVYLGNEFSSQ
ncbi:MAG: LPS export ABC transporter ATP-binding protein [OM182 bacterium]|nr:MAG: LPS export ABC transporter ATP-binding protein [OM182 bacterium]HBK19349.1 LPS export ABC transporter ATP-binding protein [Gammaproteobacteria bacterium]|tara:strand:+ start:14199 stop:14924 length:726 start_codon:yes stop_codon:yes gene_type:complete